MASIHLPEIDHKLARLGAAFDELGAAVKKAMQPFIELGIRMRPFVHPLDLDREFDEARKRIHKSVEIKCQIAQGRSIQQARRSAGQLYKG